MNIKWIVSEQCKACPKCGPRGGLDLHGLGKGVYPETEFPRLPAHRGCNCSKMDFPA